MPRRYSLANTTLGLVDPSEYDFLSSLERFASLYENGLNPYISVDAGKFIGLAKAYLELQKQESSNTEATRENQ